MNRTETIDLQRELYQLGFYAGPIDGIYGPNTERAYRDYWATRRVEIQVPVVAPEPATPWWTSRGVWGPLISLVAIGAGFVGMGFDAQEATDALIPILEAIPLVIAAVGAFVGWWGRKNAQAPIDPTLVARVGGHDLRLPARVHGKPVLDRIEQSYEDSRGHFGD